MTSERPRTGWEQWRRHQRQKRKLFSWSSSLALSLAVLGLVLWGGFPALLNVGEKGEAIAVKLGSPEGEDLPLSVSALPDPAMHAVLAAQRNSALNTVEETRQTPPDPGPAPAPQVVKKTTQKATPATPTSKPETATTPTPPRPDTKPADQTSDKPVITEKVIRGSEKGNSSELVLKPQGEKISQNAYWPVYLFMPLPAHLEASLLAKIQSTNLDSVDERRSRLLQFYKKGADGLVLTSDPGLPDRPEFWAILESAGYDVANAEYKRGKDLKPVIVTFQLGIPASPTDNPPLGQVHLEQSSVNGPVDDAVLYAFQKSTFANGTGQVAQGRYTYDFSSNK